MFINEGESADFRYIRRGAMDWRAAERIRIEGTVENIIFTKPDESERIRREKKAFVSYTDTWTLETGEREVL